MALQEVWPFVCCQQDTPTPKLMDSSWSFVPSAKSAKEPLTKQQGTEKEHEHTLSQNPLGIGNVELDDGVPGSPAVSIKIKKCGVHKLEAKVFQGQTWVSAKLVTPFCFKDWKRDETIYYCATKGIEFSPDNCFITDRTTRFAPAVPDAQQGEQIVLGGPLFPSPAATTIPCPTRCCRITFFPVLRCGCMGYQFDREDLLPPFCQCSVVTTVRDFCFCKDCCCTKVPSWPGKLDFSWDAKEKRWDVKSEKGSENSKHTVVRNSGPYLIYFSIKANNMKMRTLWGWVAEEQKEDHVRSRLGFESLVEVACKGSSTTTSRQARRLGKDLYDPESKLRDPRSKNDFLLWAANLWLEPIELERELGESVSVEGEKKHGKKHQWRITKRDGDSGLSFQDVMLEGCGEYKLSYFFRDSAELVMTAEKTIQCCLTEDEKEKEKAVIAVP